MSRRISYLVTGVLIIALASAAVTLAFAGAPFPDKSTEKNEIELMQAMIDQNRMAMMAADVCLDKAQHEKLRQMCQDALITRSQESLTMQSMLKDWYAIEYDSPRMNAAFVRHLERMPGADFEILFIQFMVRNHHVEISQGERCLEQAYHTDLIGLCHNRIVDQSQMIQWLQNQPCEWYRICKNYL